MTLTGPQREVLLQMASGWKVLSPHIGILTWLERGGNYVRLHASTFSALRSRKYLHQIDTDSRGRGIWVITNLGRQALRDSR